MRDWERESQREIPWGREHEHRALSIEAALRSAMRGDLRWGAICDEGGSTSNKHRASEQLASSIRATLQSAMKEHRAICNKRWRRRRRQRRQASYGDDEDERATTTTSELRATWPWVWFALYWVWDLVCSVLGFGLLCKRRDRGFDFWFSDLLCIRVWFFFFFFFFFWE